MHSRLFIFLACWTNIFDIASITQVTFSKSTSNFTIFSSSGVEAVGVDVEEHGRSKRTDFADESGGASDEVELEIGKVGVEEAGGIAIGVELESDAVEDAGGLEEVEDGECGMGQLDCVVGARWTQRGRCGEKVDIGTVGEEPMG